jgi:signal transduction histidine kinase
MNGQNAAPLTSLLLIYAAVLLINVVLSGFLWARYRTALHRSLFLAWASCVLSLVLQGALTANLFLMILGLLSGFPVSLALVDLLGRLLDLKIPWRAYWAVFVSGFLLSTVGSLFNLPFWMVTLPSAAALAVPVFDTPIRALVRKSREMSTIAKAAAITCMTFGLNYVDYPFLRDKPVGAVFGFSVALLVIFAASMTLPAVVLERVTGERVRIEQLGHLRSRFFANLSHELRTPLTMILAPLEGLLAEEFGPLTPTQRAYLQANQRNAIRLLKLINDLLDLAKKEEGYLRLRVERSDLRALLEEVVAYASPLASRKKLKLELTVKKLPQDLHVDVEKIERVLVNLISNALKFTSEGGVTVTLDSIDGETCLCVEDTGIGITSEGLAHIFERFRQGDGSVTRRFGGTGIGLAYAKEIVNLHGGDITVESTPGKGSRFVVRLPEGAGRIPEEVRDRRSGQIAEAPAELRRRDDQEPREWAQHVQRNNEYRFGDISDATERRLVPARGSEPLTVRILVVEDHSEILELVTLQLRDRYSVHVAQNGRAGLELARQEHPDLIISDFMMPEMDGLSMIKELRADPKFQETSIIMLTAKNQLEDRLAVRDAGVDIFLAKPFSPRELDAAVRQLLEKRGRHVNNLMRAHAEGLEIVSGGLAHEIQNPLNFIKGAQHMIFEQIAKIREQLAGAALTDPSRLAAVERSKQKIERLVQSATEGVTRIEGVVALMRRYAREGYPKEAAEVVFDQAVKEVTQLVAPPIDVDCQVEMDLQAGDAQVHLIPEEFNQVVRSLVQNAIEAVSSKGVVRVRTRIEGAQLVLEVSDNGPGIPADQVKKIFSPFFTTKTGNGRGLGLSIAQLAVSRASGAIEVLSSPGTETTFRVRLPWAPTDASRDGAHALNSPDELSRAASQN